MFLSKKENDNVNNMISFSWNISVNDVMVLVLLSDFYPFGRLDKPAHVKRVFIT